MRPGTAARPGVFAYREMVCRSFPEVHRRNGDASEKWRYAGGRKMIPIHCMRIQNSSCAVEFASLEIASPTDTRTRHIRMIAKDLATRSRKLKESAYSNSENAVIAIPAVSKSFIPLSKSRIP